MALLSGADKLKSQDILDEEKSRDGLEADMYRTVDDVEVRFIVHDVISDFCHDKNLELDDDFERLIFNRVVKSICDNKLNMVSAYGFIHFYVVWANSYLSEKDYTVDQLDEVLTKDEKEKDLVNMAIDNEKSFRWLPRKTRKAEKLSMEIFEMALKSHNGEKVNLDEVDEKFELVSEYLKSSIYDVSSYNSVEAIDKMNLALLENTLQDVELIKNKNAKMSARLEAYLQSEEELKQNK